MYPVLQEVAGTRCSGYYMMGAGVWAEGEGGGCERVGVTQLIDHIVHRRSPSPVDHLM